MKRGNLYDAPLKKGKRFRSAFTTEQVNYLEKEFRQYPYIGNARRKDVANILNIPERAVKIWFQNRRMKEKKDTSSKEPDDKMIEPDNRDDVQSTSDGSLPIINKQDERSVSEALERPDNSDTRGGHFPHTKRRRVSNDEKERISKQKEIEYKANYYKDLSEADNTVPRVRINPTVIQNNPAATSTAKFSIDLLKTYKAEKNDDIGEGRLVHDKTSLNNEVRHIAPNRHASYEISSQNLNCTSYMQASMPQDLSSKQSFHTQQHTTASHARNPDVKLNAEVPLYLKGFYAQPYIPPGNMIWKPVNVAPIMSTPIPAVAIPNVASQSVKRNCHCDCHSKPPSPVFLHQNNHNPNLQYVITAVPYQNSSIKF